MQTVDVDNGTDLEEWWEQAHVHVTIQRATAHLHALHDVTGCKQWTMEEWWEQVHARARACHNIQRATASFFQNFRCDQSRG